MDSLSSILSELIGNNGMTLIQLSNSTGIERSTLYQYLNGKRRLKSRKHLDLILQQLSISIAERSSVETAWEIQLYGEEVYLRKRYIEHFFETMPAVAQMENGKGADTEDSSVPVPDSIPGGTRNLAGSTAVKEGLYSVLCTAGKNAQVVIMAQPDNDFLESVLMHPAVYRSGIRLTLIARLSRSEKTEYRNLPILEQIMRLFSVFPDFVPLCYYSETDDSRGGVLPQNIVLTDRAAMLIPDDGGYALITEEPELLEHLSKRMDNARKYSLPIGRSFEGRAEEMGYLQKLFGRVDFGSRFEISGSFCTTPFFTRDIIRRNIDPNIPRRDELTENFTQLLAGLRSIKEAKPGVILSSIAAMNAFARTGVLQDVPISLIPAPLSAEDRITVLSAIRQGIRDGWYHLRLFRGENVMIDRRWDTMSTPTLLFIELFGEEGNRYFEFTEHTLVSMFMQYLHSIADTDRITTEEESAALLDREIERLQKDLRNGTGGRCIDE